VNEVAWAHDACVSFAEEGEDMREQEEQEYVEDDLRDPTTGEYRIIEREILPDEVICPKCGAYTLYGLDFCDSCGNVI